MSEKDVIKETRPRMETVIDDFRRKLATIRTGRAAVSLLDTVMVDYYGTMTPLNQMASVHAPEPQMLTVQPWDQTQISAVEKAIRAADLAKPWKFDGGSYVEQIHARLKGERIPAAGGTEPESITAARSPDGRAMYRTSARDRQLDGISSAIADGRIRSMAGSYHGGGALVTAGLHPVARGPYGPARPGPRCRRTPPAAAGRREASGPRRPAA